VNVRDVPEAKLGPVALILQLPEQFDEPLTDQPLTEVGLTTKT